QSALARRGDGEAEILQEIAVFLELARIVGRQHQGVAAIEPDQGFAHGWASPASAAFCIATSSPIPLPASPTSAANSSPENGACSAVAWISTNWPAPVSTKLASVWASLSSR